MTLTSTLRWSGARLWTLNPGDVRDLPDLVLFEPPLARKA
jgi:hypothetical protein